VWDSLALPDRLREWWPQLTLEPEVGGGFLEIWAGADGAERRTRGTVTTWLEPELIELDWANEDWDFSTEVALSLAAEGTETRVAICQSGWDAAGLEAEALRGSHEDGWQRHMHRWRQYLIAAS
jgi:uncharacterized protein YndB with AHSA1/START domain